MRPLQEIFPGQGHFGSAQRDSRKKMTHSKPFVLHTSLENIRFFKCKTFCRFNKISLLLHFRQKNAFNPFITTTKITNPMINLIFFFSAQVQAVCTFCGKQFTTKRKCKRHELRHTNDSKKFKCSLCPAALDTERGLKLHAIRKHAKDEDWWATKNDKKWDKRWSNYQQLIFERRSQ